MELPDLYEWLDGAGELEIDDGGYYNARVLSVEPVTEEYVLGWTRLTITFEIQPFLFLDSPTIALTSGQTVWNPGLVSDPYLKITGTGSVAITINGESFTVNFPVDQFIEIEWPMALQGRTKQGQNPVGIPEDSAGVKHNHMDRHSHGSFV